MLRTSRIWLFLVFSAALAAAEEAAREPAISEEKSAPKAEESPAPKPLTLKDDQPLPQLSESPKAQTDKAVPEKSTFEKGGAEKTPAEKAPAEGALDPALAERDASAPSETRRLSSDRKVLASKPSEIASYLRIGNTKLEQGDLVSAELAFRRVLEEHATADQDHDAMLGLARTYRKKGDFTKATAVYQKVVKLYPADPNLPALYLELGRSLRALGAAKQAITCFYSVINSTLKLPDQGPDYYRQLARTAQFEIAETYFQIGDYEQANRFFSRLKLLDLAPEDRARAHFKSVFALHLAGEHEKAVVGLRSFLDQNPDDENVPEARYLLSVSLRQLGRNQESLSTVLDLLKTEHTKTQKDVRRWTYWQRKTGNQLANEFYEHGDFNAALLIYQTLVRISNDPTWWLPVTYQIGLCSERLRMYERARECYQTIVDNVKTANADVIKRAELDDLAEMAGWRLKNLAWQQTNDNQVTSIFPSELDHAPTLTPAAESHDPNGSPAKSSNLVR